MSVQTKSVNAIRILSAEAIQKANSGHPGICLGAAPIGYELFAEHLKFSCKNPKWDNRDRFVLSAGHGSMLLYSLLHLFGFNVTTEDLKNFRQFGSRTPGHPEYGVTDGVEASTGPLGQGISNAVGMALAEAHLEAVFNKPGFPVVDHFTYVLCGEGCLEEGIGYEACSFAGTQKLGKLILFYDKNNITIEGGIDCAFGEDVATRFVAQGWQVVRVQDANNLTLLDKAIKLAKSDLSRPSIIICNSVIGYGSPAQNTAGVHGSPLGAENLAKTKAFYDWNYAPFEVPSDVREHCLAIARARSECEADWNALFARYSESYPELAQKYTEYMRGYAPDFDMLFRRLEFTKPEATRSSGGKVLNEIAKMIPNLLAGSADLSPSTKTEIKDGGYFSPENRTGRNIHFGIREHAMAGICNGIQLHGGLRIVCSTFFSFSDYMKCGMRMSAIMNIPVIYVLTHDSIGVGEDGPTHQPVEQLAMLRSIPNLKVFRPADGKETVAAYVAALTQNSPTAIALSRQNLAQNGASGIKALTGGYALNDEPKPDVLLIGTGSEVEICEGAREILAAKGIRARVISMPCTEEFEKQTAEYRESVIPKAVKARVCVEAGCGMPWYKYAGDCGEIVSIDRFGASAPAEKLFEYFGFTKENVAAAAAKSIEKAKRQ